MDGHFFSFVFPLIFLLTYLYAGDKLGCADDYRGKTNENFQLSRSPSQNLKESCHLSSTLIFRKFLHSGNPKEAGVDDNSRPMDYVRGYFEDNRRDSSKGSPVFGKNFFGGPLFPQYNFEQNADIVHMKLLRNNTFITVTDSKGNRKPGQRVSASAGSLPDKGGKSSRFGAEATAEHVGRKVRDVGVKSVVVKVNGFTYFKKKRQAIMSFREGYTNSRGDQNPIVYIEDTTRRPHNGCRLPKKRRI